MQAEAAQVAQGDRRRLDVGEQRRLGDLQPQRVGGDPGLAEHLGDEVGERRVDHLARPDVDRQRGVGEGQVARPPHGELGQGVGEHGGPDLVDQPGLLGHRQELVGRQQAALGVQPAGERLEAGHVAGGQLDDRLEVGHDLAALEAAPQLGRRAQGEHRRLVRARSERLDAVTPACLGPIHRRVGVAEQVGGGHALAVVRPTRRCSC